MSARLGRQADAADRLQQLGEDLQRERGLGADEASALLQGYDRSPHLDAVLEDRDWTVIADTAGSGALAAQVLGSTIEVAMTTNPAPTDPHRR